jgi:hypothetical protein
MSDIQKAPENRVYLAVGHGHHLFVGNNLAGEILGVGSDPKVHDRFVTLFPLRKKLRKARGSTNTANQHAGGKWVERTRVAHFLCLQESLHLSHDSGRCHVCGFIYDYNSVHPTFTM